MGLSWKKMKMNTTERRSLRSSVKHLWKSFSCFINEIRVTNQLAIFWCRPVRVSYLQMGDKNGAEADRCWLVRKADVACCFIPSPRIRSRLAVTELQYVTRPQQTTSSPREFLAFLPIIIHKIVSSVRHNCVCDFHFVVAVPSFFFVQLLGTRN